MGGRLSGPLPAPRRGGGGTPTLSRGRLGDKLRNFTTSFREHYDKIVDHWNDRSQQYAINGWVGDCRSFARQLYETEIHILSIRETVIDSATGNELSHSEVQRRYQERINHLEKLQQQNFSRE